MTLAERTSGAGEKNSGRRSICERTSVPDRKRQQRMKEEMEKSWDYRNGLGPNSYVVLVIGVWYS